MPSGKVVSEQIFQDCNLGASVLCEELKVCLGPCPSRGLGEEMKRASSASFLRSSRYDKSHRLFSA